MFLHCIQHMAVIFLLIFYHFLEFDPSKADVYLYKGIEEVRKVLPVYDTGMCAWKNIYSFYFSFLLLGLFENQKKGYNKRKKSKRQADKSKISKNFFWTLASVYFGCLIFWHDKDLVVRFFLCDINTTYIMYLSIYHVYEIYMIVNSQQSLWSNVVKLLYLV